MSGQGGDDKVAHLADYRSKDGTSPEDEVDHKIDLRLSVVLRDHFREQTDIISQQNGRLEEQNRQMSDKVSRLLNGMERLLGEVDAVRTGKQDEAFARVARHDEGADLPTIQADVSVLYPYTSGDIGAQLGFGATQIGTLLGKQGLGWVGDGTYEEMARWRQGRQRYWHKDVPQKLSTILLTKEPSDFGVKNKSICNMFAHYRERVATNKCLDASRST